MNWRRGLLLAGIHLAVAGSLAFWREAQMWPYLHAETIPQPSATLRLVVWQEEEQTVGFDPCTLWHSIPPQELVVVMAELPAAVLSGWGEDCPASWTLGGILHAGIKGTRHANLRLAAGLCALIPIQWFILGGFPPVRPRRWWLEPGAFITVCMLVAFVFVLIPPIGALARLPMLVAFFAWLWWFVLLIWKTLRFGWGLATRRTAIVG